MIMGSRGRPKLDTQPVVVRMRKGLVDELDDARRAASDLPTRPEMVRRILERWAEGRKGRSGTG